MEIMPIPPRTRWYTQWWGIPLVIFFVIVFGVGGFLGIRVWYYYREIQKRGIDAVRLDFTSRFTPGSAAASGAEVIDPNLVRHTSAPSFGNKNAKLTIVEFADFECPYSKEESSTFRELSLRYKDQVNFVYRDFPLDAIHEHARLAAEAGQCAASQGNFWLYHDKLYGVSPALDKNSLLALAAQSGLDQTKFKNCLESAEKRDTVQADYDAGARAGVRGTPTFFINGLKIEGAIPKDTFNQIIQKALEEEPKA